MNDLGQIVAPTAEWEDGRSADRNSDRQVTLRLLTAVHANSALTQRTMSRELGIALGLANAYLKRCVSKGLIKISQVPPNRYAYYLTGRGIAEKGRLTAEFLSQSFKLFRVARSEYDSAVADCAANGWQRVALWGIGSLSEVALLSFGRTVEVVGFVDPNATAPEFLGRPLVAELGDLGTVDAVLVTATDDPQGAFDAACRVMPAHRVIAPHFLHVDRYVDGFERP